MARRSAWSGLGAQLGEGRRRVHVPEDADGVRPRSRDDAFEQLVVEDADAERLHDDIGLRGLGDDGAHRLLGRRIDLHLRPVRRVDVAMLLPVEGVRLVERDPVAAAARGRASRPR